MIGNEKKLELIRDRKETLKQMKELLWGLSQAKTPELRAAYMETIKVFGASSADLKDRISKL